MSRPLKHLGCVPHNADGVAGHIVDDTLLEVHDQYDRLLPVYRRLLRHIRVSSELFLRLCPPVGGAQANTDVSLQFGLGPAGDDPGGNLLYGDPFKLGLGEERQQRGRGT